MPVGQLIEWWASSQALMVAAAMMRWLVAVRQH